MVANARSQKAQPWYQALRYSEPLLMHNLARSIFQLQGLPWAFPGWVGNGSGSPYTYPQQTATYVTNWVAGAEVRRRPNLSLFFFCLFAKCSFSAHHSKRVSISVCKISLFFFIHIYLSSSPLHLFHTLPRLPWYLERKKLWRYLCQDSA